MLRLPTITFTRPVEMNVAIKPAAPAGPEARPIPAWVEASTGSVGPETLLISAGCVMPSTKSKSRNRVKAGKRPRKSGD